MRVLHSLNFIVRDHAVFHAISGLHSNLSIITRTPHMRRLRLSRSTTASLLPNPLHRLTQHHYQWPASPSATLSSAHSQDSSLASFLLLQRLFLPSILCGLLFLSLTLNVRVVWAQSWVLYSVASLILWFWLIPQIWMYMYAPDFQTGIFNLKLSNSLLNIFSPGYTPECLCMYIHILFL